MKRGGSSRLRHAESAPTHRTVAVRTVSSPGPYHHDPNPAGRKPRLKMGFLLDAFCRNVMTLMLGAGWGPDGLQYPLSRGRPWSDGHSRPESLWEAGGLHTSLVKSFAEDDDGAVPFVVDHRPVPPDGQKAHSRLLPGKIGDILLIGGPLSGPRPLPRWPVCPS